MSTNIAATPGRPFSATHQPACFSEGRKRAGGTLRILCPHCNTRAAVRTSRALTPLFRELFLQCTNLECSHTFVASLTIDRTIVPSATPNPRIRLKMSAPRAPANEP